MPSQLSTAQPSGEEILSPDAKNQAGPDSPLLPKLVGTDSPTLLNSPNAARRKPKIRSSTNLSESTEAKNPLGLTTSYIDSPGTPLLRGKDKEQRSASKPSFRVRDSGSNPLLRTGALTKPSAELAVLELSGISTPIPVFPYKQPPATSVLESLRGQEPTRRFSIRPAALGVDRKHQKSNSCIPANLSNLVSPPRSLAASPAPQKAVAVSEDLPRKTGFKWDISSLTGFNPNHFKENQDYAAVHHFDLPSNRLSGICETMWAFLLADGHGSNGGLASKTAADRLLHHLETLFREAGPSKVVNLAEDSVKEIICTSFEKTQEELRLDAADRFRSSGTTMVLVLFYREVFYFCNVGDSKVIFCSTGAHRLQLVCRYESKLHKPNDPEELKRIEVAGGQVWVLVDESSQKHVAPPRVWNRARTEPGLATSRSLGDTYGHTIGLSCRPGKHHTYLDITTKKLATNDKYLVLASDGVWDVMNTKDVMDKCNSFLPREAASEAAKRIVRDAAAIWNKVDNSLFRKRNQETTSPR